MYFAVIGRQHKLCLRELQWFSSPEKTSEHIVIVSEPVDFSRLGGVVKWWKVVTEADLAAELDWVDLVGSADDQLAKLAKRTYGVRRYKTYNLLHSDKEVREKGVELVTLWDMRHETWIGVVTGWQDIKRFETIDFEKPVRGMEIGMMPGKLTQMLLNIWVWAVIASKPEASEAISSYVADEIAASSPATHETPRNDDNSPASSKDLTIYDPFCGFGTTLFVANSLGYNAIGSDANPALSQQNMKWRPTTQYATDKKMTVFKHDATEAYIKPFLDHVDVIVTEWRLGPVVYENTHPDALEQHMRKILEVYVSSITAMRERMQIPIVITLPSYSRLPLDTVQKSIDHVTKFTQQNIQYIWRYARKGQLVHREILLIS